MALSSSRPVSSVPAGAPAAAASRRSPPTALPLPTLWVPRDCWAFKPGQGSFPGLQVCPWVVFPGNQKLVTCPVHPLPRRGTGKGGPLSFGQGVGATEGCTQVGPAWCSPSARPREPRRGLGACLLPLSRWSLGLGAAGPGAALGRWRLCRLPQPHSPQWGPTCSGSPLPTALIGTSPAPQGAQPAGGSHQLPRPPGVPGNWGRAGAATASSNQSVPRPRHSSVRLSAGDRGAAKCTRLKDPQVAGAGNGTRATAGVPWKPVGGQPRSHGRVGWFSNSEIPNV